MNTKPTQQYLLKFYIVYVYTYAIGLDSAAHLLQPRKDNAVSRLTIRDAEVKSNIFHVQCGVDLRLLINAGHVLCV